MEPIISAIAISSAASFLLAKVLVWTTAGHGRFTLDMPGAIQKFHHCPTPRVGGIGIYLALVTAAAYVPDAGVRRILAILLVASAPALAMGLLEDVTQRVSVSTRLAATFASGALACWLSDVELQSVDVPLVDALLAIGPVAFLFTAFAVAGVANAINMIDGFHGLASGTATLALASLAVVSAKVGDPELAIAASILAAAVAGFWLVNFPWGKLFLGDGGAYFAGFALAWIAVLLPIRNPAVSPWASLLVCGYPVIEALYSIVRRSLRHQSPGHADRAHLHSMMASRVVLPRLRGLDPDLQNAAVSVVMWICAAIPALLGVTFYRETPWLVAGAAACLLLYHWLYRSLARR